MQINVHDFTLTTSATARIKVQSDSATLHDLPITVIKTLAETEALDLTGFEWITAAYSIEETETPAGEPAYIYNVKINKA